MTKKRRSPTRYEVSPHELVAVPRWFIAFIRAIILSQTQRQFDRLLENYRQQRLARWRREQVEAAHTRTTRMRKASV